MIKSGSQLSFANLAVSQRKIKSVFFEQVNTALDWRKIDSVIGRYYKKGTSADGRPAYSGLVLFKMCLLQYWYNLSDYEVEAQCNDSISFSTFLGISLDGQIPDHSVLSRFRSELTSKGGWELLFNEVNRQLEARNIIVKTGLIVDASVTDSPLKPKGKKTYPIAEDRKEEEAGAAAPAEAVKDGVDKEAAWLKKAGRLHYGYKKHIGTDAEGMVLAVVTTPANESDVCHLTDVIDKAGIAEQSTVKADKGYRSEQNQKGLKQRKLRSHIMHKAVRGKKLNERQTAFNKAVSRLRYKIERTFGSMKRWSGAGTARYKGLAKTHAQHLLEAMAHNLYRMPGLAALATERKSLSRG